MTAWHASGRRPFPLQVTPLTSHLFPVVETEEECDGKRRVGEGMWPRIHVRYKEGKSDKKTNVKESRKQRARILMMGC